MSDEHEPVEVVTKHDPRAINTHAIVIAEQRRLRGEPVTPHPLVPRGIHYPDTPPMFEHETDSAYTDRLCGVHGNSPYDHRRFRQCSIGYHKSCSDPGGDECRCPCHRERGSAAGITATKAAATVARVFFLPLPTAQRLVNVVNMAVMVQGSPLGGRAFEQVRDAIGAVEGWSRPGAWFTADLINILGLADQVVGMPSRPES